MKRDTDGKSTSHTVEFLAGYGSGLANVSVTFPIHKLMFRTMLHDVPTAVAFRQLRSEGIGLLYKGLLPPLLQKTVTSSIMFGGYDYYGTVLRRQFPGGQEQVLKSAGAAMAGVTEAVLVPFERIQTILQDKRHNSDPRLNNTAAAARYLYRNHGVRELYRGATPIVVRNALCSVLFFISKEKGKELLPETDRMWENYLHDFAIGGVIGGAISSSFYPVNVVKTYMQCSIGGPFRSNRTVFEAVFKERDRSWAKVFRGVHLHYSRSMVSWGITNATYELLKGLLTREGL